MSNPVALITGASSGIGRAFAEVFASNGYDLVVSARREARLEELAEDLDCVVTPIAADLATTRGASQLFKETREIGIGIDVLVNNAGVSASGPFAELEHARLTDILNVNVRALADVTHAFLPSMLERGSGRILNVASVAAFRAVPGLSVYSASKAFVLSFTESLAEEIKDTGVTVTALCPGLTKTEMVDDLVAQTVPDFLLADADAVAREGYDACVRGEVIRVPGEVNQAMVNWLEMQPRWLVRMMSGFAARASFMAPR